MRFKQSLLKSLFSKKLDNLFDNGAFCIKPILTKK